MQTIIIIHSQLSNTIWLFFLILGGWGLFRAFRSQSVDGSYLGAVAIGQILYVVQAVLGFSMWFTGLDAIINDFTFHLLYGLFAMVFLPFVYLVLLKGDDSNRAQWVWALCTLFMFGIALRAIDTSV